MNVVLPRIDKSLTSEQLRLRILAVLNGARSAEDLRKAIQRAGRV